MKSVLLIGCGRFGLNIAKELTRVNVSVLAVDRIEERVNSILPYVTSSEIGDVKDKTFLQSLGINNFDSIILTIDDDFESSVVAVTLLKELGGKEIICRASSEIQEKILLNNGADKIVFPEREGAKTIALKSILSSLEDYIPLDDCSGIFEFKTPLSWIGKSIIELDIRKNHEINILALRENGKVNMGVSGDTIFSENSNVLVSGAIDRVKKVFKNESN